MSKKIVVLGGGYAGVLTAKKLAAKLKKTDTEITLIDRSPFHTMLTELHEVAAQRVGEDSIRIDLRRVFAGRNVSVVTDEIVSADYGAKKLIGQRSEYEYDYLVLATGSKPTFFGVPGAQEHTYTLWSYDDAVLLRDRINNVFKQAAVEPDKEKRRFLLTFFIVGAGFSGVEMTGELAELAPVLCEKFDIDLADVTIYEGDMLPRPVPVLPEKLSAKVQKRLEKLGVKLMLGKNTSGVGEDWLEYKDSPEAEPVRLPVNTVIWTAGIEGSDVATAAEELGQKGRGRVETDKHLRSLTIPNVYIAGDNLFYIPEGEERPVPQMVENAEHSADTIAHNLAAEVLGSGELEEYKPKFHGMMVCIGGRYGTAHVGLPGKFFALPSFFAMLAKHFINILYFMQVLGWNKVVSYCRHEFFRIGNNRSFVGGHFSNKTPSYLLVPLRIFLGAYWVYEALVKAFDGFLSRPLLDGFFGGANAFYDSILTPAAAFNSNTLPSLGAAVVDTVSSATSGGFTGVAVGPIVEKLANPVLMDLDIFGILRFILVNSGDVAFKVKFAPVDWLINSVILPSEGLQIFFQIFIVVAELLIGLALIGGLFNFLASSVSLGLQTMFLMSTGLYMHSWWMIFASIAVLIGGGRVFGLDYYVGPAMKKWWKNRKFVRKWYLYNDD